jgi:Carboxypeptidase regulatory-like domain
MTSTRLFLVASLLVGGVRAQAPDSDKTGSITGIVRDSVTHMPVKKATVSINAMFAMPVNSANAAKVQQPQATVTDASGTFTVASLPPGRYRVVIQHQNYPQARFGGLTKNVDVKAGESGAPLAVDLVPGGAVSGRILDEEGEPIQGCFVQPHPAKNPEQGVQMSGNPSTNEDGDYRFYSVPPGKYVFTAQCNTAVFQPRPFSAGADPPPSRGYPIQYYPLATDAKAAEAVELTPGGEKSGVDFRMRPAPVTQIHGIMSPGSADWKGRNLTLELMPVDPVGRNGMFSNSAIDQAKGTFEFRQVFPGSYTLLAFSNDNDDKRIGVAQRIEVNDRPLDIVLELHHGFDLSGKVEFDASSTTAATPAPTGNTGVIGSFPGGLPVGGRAISGLANPNGKPSLNSFGLQLFPTYQVGMPFPQTQVSEDGSFTFKGVIPAVWRIQVNGPMAFVKSAFMGSTEVTTGSLDLSNGAAGALRIVLSMNTATIRGSAPAGQFINAQRIDEDTPFRTGRGAMVDPSGQYTMPNLPPGRYRLVVTDAGFQADEGGQEVTVHEGETVMLDLKAPTVQ